MAVVLGKRKTRPSEEESAEALAKAQAIFQRHFESTFAPLHVAPVQSASRPGGDEDEDAEDLRSDTEGSESEWDGLSADDDDEPEIEIVSHEASNEPTTSMSKRDMKAFMSSRPPTDPALTTASQKPKKKSGKADDGDEDSQTLLANDLALQRLISESHILARAGGNPSYFTSTAQKDGEEGGKLFAEGRTRRLTTIMRMEAAMGREAAIPKQAKMPMAMRKGMNARAADKEEKRRREAKENGVILERKGGKPKEEKKRRSDMPVDMPGIGKMRGSELRISARDVRTVEGPKRTVEKKRKKRR